MVGGNGTENNPALVAAKRGGLINTSLFISGDRFHLMRLQLMRHRWFLFLGIYIFLPPAIILIFSFIFISCRIETSFYKNNLVNY